MDTFVPVLFYDVVDDQYVLQEDELLQENLPDIVIWKDDVPNCKKVHEESYRNGEKLKQRELKEFWTTAGHTLHPVGRVW